MKMLSSLDPDAQAPIIRDQHEVGMRSSGCHRQHSPPPPRLPNGAQLLPTIHGTLSPLPWQGSEGFHVVTCPFSSSGPKQPCISHAHRTRRPGPFTRNSSSLPTASFRRKSLSLSFFWTPGPWSPKQCLWAMIVGTKTKAWAFGERCFG